MRKRVGWEPPARHQTMSGGVPLFQVVASVRMRVASLGWETSALRKWKRWVGLEAAALKTVSECSRVGRRRSITWIAWIADSSFATLRATITIFAPFCERIFATLRPRPSEAPVRRMLCSLSATYSGEERLVFTLPSTGK